MRRTTYLDPNYSPGIFLNHSQRNLGLRFGYFQLLSNERKHK